MFYNISALLESQSHVIKLNKWTAYKSRVIRRIGKTVTVQEVPLKRP